MSRQLYTWVLLFCCTAPLILHAAQRESALLQSQQRLAELADLLATDASTLQLRLPNKSEVLAADQAGIRAGVCEAPVLVRIQPAPTFMAWCKLPRRQYLSTRSVHFVVRWTYAQDQWQPGRVLRLYGQNDWSSQLRNTKQPETWHSATRSSADPLERTLAELPYSQVEHINQFWASLPQLSKELSAIKLPEETWPTAVIAIDRKGDVLLQPGSLVGIGELRRVIAKQKLPEGALGAARVKLSPALGGAASGFLLSTLSHHRKHLAFMFFAHRAGAALIKGEPVWADKEGAAYLVRLDPE